MICPVSGMKISSRNVGRHNAALAADGKIERFSHIKPGTGGRGRPGVDRLNDLPRGDVLFFDEITGVTYQGGFTLGRHEVSDLAFEAFAGNLRSVA